MKKSNIFSFILLLLFWHVIALIIGNDIILPTPIQVVVQMGMDIGNPHFFIIIGSTLSKALVSFGWALLLGIILAIWSGASPLVERLFRPIDLLLKTIPNITYMFLLLLWLPSERAVSYVVFFIVFPVFYANVLGGMKAMDQDLRDVLVLYGETKRTRFFKIYLPQTYPYIKSAIFSTLSLSIKVGVMAEVLGQVKYGVGKEMFVSKLNLDMVNVFSWTIWIVLLVTLLEWLCKILFSLWERAS